MTQTHQDVQAHKEIQTQPSSPEAFRPTTTPATSPDFNNSFYSMREAGLKGASAMGYNSNFSLISGDQTIAGAGAGTKGGSDLSPTKPGDQTQPVKGPGSDATKPQDSQSPDPSRDFAKYAGLSPSERDAYRRQIKEFISPATDRQDHRGRDGMQQFRTK